MCTIIAKTIIICLYYISILYAHTPVISWTKSYGGYGNESIKLINRTFDKGYIILGTTTSIGSSVTDIYLIKLDEDCDTIWTRTYGGIYDDFGNSLLQTADSNYLVAGRIWYRGWEGDDMYLLKVDPEGDMIWSRKYGEMKRYNSALSIIETADGGFAVLADSGSVSTSGHFDAHLIKIDRSGEKIWERNVSGSNLYDIEFGSMMKITSDGGYIIIGSIGSEIVFHSDFDLWLTKTTAEGEIMWTKTYGGMGPDAGRGIYEADDNGYVLMGCIAHKIPIHTIKGDGWVTWKEYQLDIYLIKTDNNGDTLWTKIYGGDKDDEAYAAQITLDGGFIIGGYTESYGNGGKDIYIIKTNVNGEILWSMTYGGFGDDRCFSIIEAHDGGYIAGCTSNSFGRGDTDIYTIRIKTK